MGVEARCAIDCLRLDRALDDGALADAHRALAATGRATGVVRLTGQVLHRAGQPMLTVV